MIPAERPAEGSVGARRGFVVHVTGNPSAPAPPADAVAGLRSAGVAYRALGWPIVLRRDEVWLHLDDAVALVIPAILGTDVAEILIQRRCPPPVLAHPALPAHRVILAGDRFCVPLPWPTSVHRVTDSVLLPPTVTPCGPVLWVHPPQPHALKLCREIDVFAALQTAPRHQPHARSGAQEGPPDISRIQ